MTRRKQPVIVYLPPGDPVLAHLVRFANRSAEAARLMRAALENSSGSQRPLPHPALPPEVPERTNVPIPPPDDKDPGWDAE
ncbi:MAG TPA: hypothetical protein VGK74_15570 [Symbiobacteriaceae bacterium]|jgi:hypothetical protein